MTFAQEIPANLREANLWIEGIVAGAIALSFVVSARFSLKPHHRGGDGVHVDFGAAIYGLLFGAIIGFIIVPLRMGLMNGELPPQVSGFAGLGAFVIIIALRRGVIGRLPFLGPQARAYRKAVLRRQIETAEKELGRLTARAEPA